MYICAKGVNLAPVSTIGRFEIWGCFGRVVYFSLFILLLCYLLTNLRLNGCKLNSFSSSIVLYFCNSGQKVISLLV